MKNILEKIKEAILFIFKLIFKNKGFLTLIAIILIYRFVFISVDTVVGESMLPTLRNDDVVIVDKQIYKLTELDRFDIITFDIDETEGENFLVKRVIGFPGETVEIKDGVLYIDGKKTEVEEHVKIFNAQTNDFKSEVVPEGHYFVLGDNRAVSLDSRSSLVGFVSEDTIHGKVIFREKPFNSMGFVK